MSSEQGPVFTGNSMTVFKIAAGVSGFGLVALTALVLWIVMGPREPTPEDQARAALVTVAQALAHYRLGCHVLPTTEQGLQALLTPPARGPLCTAVPTTILESLPMDPWGHPFVYKSDGQTFTLTSYGRDGKEGGEGIDADIVFRGSP